MSDAPAPAHGPLLAPSPRRLRPRVALELLKPLTWFPPIWAFGCGAVAAPHMAPGRLGALLLGLLLAGPLVCGASQATNDWFDREVDAIDQPARPVPSGRAPGRTALQLAVGWSGLSLLAGALLGPFVLAATLLGLVLAWAYSAPPVRLKARGWWGPAAVALSYEGLAWLTGEAVASGAAPSPPGVAAALLFSLGAVGIMILNDFKSMEGDRRAGLKSVPVLIGAAPAARAACALMTLGQLGVMLLLVLWNRGLWAGAGALLLALQLALQPRLLRDPKGQAPWYNGTGTGLYVLAMLLAAFAIRTLP